MMTEITPEAENIDPELAGHISEMRRTLVAAPLTAIFAAARIAIHVRTDSEAVLKHLDTTNRTHFGDTSDAHRGRTGVLLDMQIQTWLNVRGDERRTAKRRRDDLRRRAVRAQDLLGSDDPEVRKRWDQYYRELAREEGSLEEALAALRALLAERGWRTARDPLDFGLSLATQNFASALRRSSSLSDRAEGERITEMNAKWRAETFGARHPFTMVAEGNRLLDVFYRLERTSDEGEFGPNDRRAAIQVGSDANKLYKNRMEVLGVHHGATVLAMSYQARALRLLGDAQEARAIAERAIAHYLTFSAKNDTTITAILRVIAAEGYAAEAEKAERNVSEALTSGALEVIATEVTRATEVWQTVDTMLNLAEADLVRWPNQAPWLTRLRNARARRSSSTVGR